MITSVVSNIGRPKITIGIAKVKACVFVNLSFSPIIARRNPRNILPVSPINIWAGLKLYLRNPKQLPARAADKEAIKNCPFIAERIKKKEAAMPAIPTDKPSILSKRLKALVIPTTHKNVRGISISGLLVKDTFVPKIMTNQQAKIWAESFKKGEMLFISSHIPMAMIIREANKAASSSILNEPNKEKTNKKVKAMANPPKSGIGSICIFLWLGISTTPHFKASLLIIGVVIRAQKIEARNIERYNFIITNILAS